MQVKQSLQLIHAGIGMQPTYLYWAGAAQGTDRHEVMEEQHKQHA